MSNHHLILLFLISCLAASCTQEDIPNCHADEKVLHSLVSFPLGVAVDQTELNFNEAYEQIVSQQFNSITPENIFKPQYLQPVQDQFSWEAADQLVAYCMDHDMRLHGHTLIWHNQLPFWMEQFQGSPETWEQMMKTHIQTVVKHFKGKVTSWDVVNEAIEDDGSFRENIWLANIGESYIEKAFQYAHEAESAVKLFYNDYSLSAKRKKRDAVIELLNSLREKGIRVDGIGLQMHIAHNYPSNNAIAKALEEVWENDYLIHISELDIAINPLGREMPTASTSRLIKQAEKYKAVFEAYQEVPADYQHGISIWGISDRDSWIPSFFGRDDYPLLFDAMYQPKPAFCNLP